MTLDLGVLDTALDQFVDAVDPAITPGVIVRVEHRGTSTIWSAARGVCEIDGDPLAVDDAFRVASVAKTFTSATVLAMVEDGLVTVDQPILSVVPGPMRTLLAAIDPTTLAEITVDRLLTHTSGVHDFGTEPEYFARVDADPAHRWDDLELVELSMRRGPMHGRPGGGFHYSDTGYTLLGSMIEHILGSGLPDAYRWMLSRGEVDLRSTWLEGRESPPDPGPRRVHQYLGGVDTHAMDPSCDTWGGGGLVSTAADLATFIDALFDGRLVREAGLLGWMLDCAIPTDLGDLGAWAGRGVFRTPVAGVERFGHEGFWGVWMHHLPALGLTVTGTHTGVPVTNDVRAALFAAPVKALVGGTPDRTPGR